MVEAHGCVLKRQLPAAARLIALIATVLPRLMLLPTFHGHADCGLGWRSQAEASRKQHAGLADGADERCQWMAHGLDFAARGFFQRAFRRTKAVPWPVNI